MKRIKVEAKWCNNNTNRPTSTKKQDNNNNMSKRFATLQSVVCRRSNLTVDKLDVVPDGNSKGGRVDVVPLTHREVRQIARYLKFVIKKGTELAKPGPIRERAKDNV